MPPIGLAVELYNYVHRVITEMERLYEIHDE